MHDTLSLLEKKERLLKKKSEAELEKAKELLKKKNQSGATLALKRKKTYDTQITRLQAQMANIEQLNMKLEEAATDKMTLDAQKKAARELKNVFKGTSVEKIEESMDKVREAMDDANEISEALAQSFGVGFDEGDLEDELAELMREEVEEQLLGMKEVPKGEISKGSVKVSKTEEDIDDEFAELEKEFA